MKLLITGSRGQLGSELQKQLSCGGCSLGPIPEKLRGADVCAVDLSELDLTDKAAVRQYLEENDFDAVINCAAYTNVDGCESNFDDAFKVNALAVRYLAESCAATNTKLLHVSTDYVFAGDADKPYTEADVPSPRSAYGKTKLLGETYLREACPDYFIVRTAWLYGNGKNFVKAILSRAKSAGQANVVNDQLGNPTSAVDLAYHILKIVVTENYGIYHCTCEGVCSWYDFAAEIVKLSGLDATVFPCTTAEFPSKTKRPAYSALDNGMLRMTVGNEARDWHDALAEYMKTSEIGELLK